MPPVRWILGLGIIVGGMLFAGSMYLGPSVNVETGVDTAAGRKFAERKCAGCHAVGQTGQSPYVSAPPFRTFAKLWPLQNIEEALAEGIVMDHPAMPEFTLTPGQIANFIAYLETIQR